MTDGMPPGPPFAPAAAAARLPPAPEAPNDGGALDLWLARTLRKAFDGALTEPVPESLLRLLEPDR